MEEVLPELRAPRASLTVSAVSAWGPTATARALLVAPPAAVPRGLWYEQPQSSQIFALQQMLLYIFSFPKAFGYYGENQGSFSALMTSISFRVQVPRFFQLRQVNFLSL